MLTNSILATVRAMCNVEEDDQGFDQQLIPLINGQLMMAHQFGVGYAGFIITDEHETWYDLLGESGKDLLNAMQIWLGYSVRLLFDPPDNSTVLKSYQDQILKMEWMLCNISFIEGHVKEYVPDQKEFYDKLEENSGRPKEVYYERIAERTVDED